MILKDVEGTWAYSSIMNLVEKNIVSGFEGEFKPESNVNRAEFAKMIAIAFGLKSTNNVNVFSDVGSDKWYNEFVSALYEAGIMLGVFEQWNSVRIQC